MLKKYERSILVPVNTWYGNAPELAKKGIDADIGAVAESLIYYDTVLINVEDKYQFHSILEWFKETDSPDSLLKMMINGDILFYYYDFYVNPIYDPQTDSFSLMNIQEPIQNRLHHFRQRVVGSVSRYFNTHKKRMRFLDALEDSVIVVTADKFGTYIENAREFILVKENYRNLMESLINSLVKAGYIDNIPDINVWESKDPLGNPRININLNFDHLKSIMGEKSDFGKHTPIAIASVTNRLIWSTAMANSDIYANEPMFGFISTRFTDLLTHFKNTKSNLHRLKLDVDFPDIREEVNSRAIGAYDIMKIREISGDFRLWLHKQTDLDRDIINSYYHDIIDKSGIKPNTKKLLNIALITSLQIAGSEIGATVSPESSINLGTALSAAAIPFVSSLYNKLVAGWSPRIFGSKLHDILDK